MRFLGRHLLVALAFLSSALALDLASLKPQGYVSDFANVIDAESRNRIDLYAARLEKATGAQIAIVTLTTLEGEPIEDVANDLFRRWGIGQKGQDNGLLFLLVIRDRRADWRSDVDSSRLSPMAARVPRCGRCGRRCARVSYGDALWIAATSLGSVIAQDKGVQVDLGGPQAPRPAPPACL